MDVNKEILFPINNNNIINNQAANITYDRFLSTMNNVKDFISKIITIAPINLEISYLTIFHQNVIENLIKQITDNFLLIVEIFKKKNENDLFQMFFIRIINNIILNVKLILNFDKPLNAHILKQIDLKEKILKQLQLTIKNDSIFEETKNIFSDFFNFFKDSNTEIEYDKIYKNINEIFFKYSQNTNFYSSIYLRRTNSRTSFKK